MSTHTDDSDGSDAFSLVSDEEDLEQIDPLLQVMDDEKDKVQALDGEGGQQQEDDALMNWSAEEDAELLAVMSEETEEGPLESTSPNTPAQDSTSARSHAEPPEVSKIRKKTEDDPYQYDAWIQRIALTKEYLGRHSVALLQARQAMTQYFPLSEG